MTDYKGAIWLPNNNYFANTGKKRYLIIHATAGGSSAEAIASYFKGTEGTANPVSSHYIVGQDGTVVQTVAEKDGAWANGVVNNPDWLGNPNNYTISIEFVKSSTDNSDDLTDAQKKAGFPLIKDICKRNNIGMHEANAATGITGHYSIDPINRSRCPGLFPWNDLWAYLGGNTMNVPNGWTDDGTTLKGPDGTPVALGFRDHVLNSSWDPANWPLEPEQHLDLIEQSNPSLGPGQVQTFRWKRLEYTPKMGVFEGWLGQELFWYQQQYPQLQKQVADLDTAIDKLQSDISTLQSENDKLKALLASSNLGQIESLGKQIQDDVALILKLVQVH